MRRFSLSDYQNFSLQFDGCNSLIYFDLEWYKQGMDGKI